MQASSALARVTCALFIAAIGAPCADQVLRPDAARSVLREQRTPAPKPALAADLAVLSTYPGAYEAWYNDRFGLRDKLLRWHNAWKLLVLGVEPSNTLVAGENGWLFFRADDSVEVFRGTKPFAPDELEAWRTALEERRDWLRTYDCDYMFVVVPNKEEIYTEHMPDDLDRVGPTRLDQLADHMRHHSDVVFLDLRRALRAEKAHDTPGNYVYHPLGTHWTARGAWAGANAILGHLKQSFPAIDPYPRERFGLHLRPGEVEDSWGPVLYLDAELPQPFYEFTLTGESRARTLYLAEFGERSSSTIDDPALPRVVMLHDSFGPWIRPFMAEQCSLFTSSAQYGLTKELVWSERPQVLIQMYTERSFVWRIVEMPKEAEAVDAQSFAAAGELLVDWDPSALPAGTDGTGDTGGPAQIEPYLATPMRLATQWPEPALEVEVDGAGGWLQLPELALPDGGHPVLHAQFTSPFATVFEVLYKLEGQSEYLRKNLLQAPVRRGRNELYLKIPVAGIQGRLLVRMGTKLGTYYLHDLEVRAMR